MLTEDQNPIEEERQQADNEVRPEESARKKKTTGSSHRKEIEELGNKVIELNDKYLRLSAEFDNYRKRTLKEKMDLTKYGGESVLVKILSVVDNLERAMVSIRETSDIDAVIQGIELIYNNFSEFLTQNGIKPIESLNMEFNSDIHEAITKIPVTDPEQKGKVVDVIQTGYYMYDRVIRFAKVVVGE